MPHPRFQKPNHVDKRPAGTPDSHYFDAAQGDVAALHERIERGFIADRPGESPFSPASGQLDATIRFLSRSAGIVGLVGALILIGFNIF